MSRIWFPEVEAMLRNEWNKKSPNEISKMINAWLDEYYGNKKTQQGDKYKAWNLTDEGGVMFAAARIGIISKRHLEKWHEKRKKESRKIVRANRNECPEELRQKILKKYGICVICGSEKDLTVDHIVALSKGGTNVESNLWCLCRKCNASKSNKTLIVEHPDGKSHIEITHAPNRNQRKAIIKRLRRQLNN